MLTNTRSAEIVAVLFGKSELSALMMAVALWRRNQSPHS